MSNDLRGKRNSSPDYSVRSLFFSLPASLFSYFSDSSNENFTPITINRLLKITSRSLHYRFGFGDKFIGKKSRRQALSPTTLPIGRRRLIFNQPMYAQSRGDVRNNPSDLFMHDFFIPNAVDRVCLFPRDNNKMTQNENVDIK